MKFILAILFAIPTYGASFIVLFIYMIYKTMNVRKNTEAAIKFLSRTPSNVGACVEGISYLQAYAYLSEFGEIKKIGSNFYEYSLDIDGEPYAGTLGVEPLGSLAMLTSEDMSWVKPVRVWLKKYLKADSLELVKNITRVRNIGGDGEIEFLPSMDYIPDQLFNWQRLEGVYLEDTEITHIPKSVANCASLEELRIDGSCISKLPSEIFDCQNIKYITIVRSCIVNIPASIENAKSLERIDFWDNKIVELPPQLFNVETLSDLYLSNNKITEIPQGISRLNSLKRLRLSGNQLEILPAEVCYLPELDSLDISNNKLTKLPNEIGELFNLTRLEAHGNPLSSLPDTIRYLKKLELLTIGNVPEVELSEGQLYWIDKLKSDGCVIWLHCKNLKIGSDNYFLEEIEKLSKMCL